jgi:hypothetical protein
MDNTHQTGALDKQLEAERGGFPLAEAVGKIAQTAFENWMQRARLGTEQKVGQGRIDRAEAQAAKLQDQIDNPKETQPKNADEALVAAMSETDPEKKAAKMAIVQALHKQEVARVREGQPPKAEKDTSLADAAKAIQVSEYKGREHDKVDGAMEKERSKRYEELSKDYVLEGVPAKMEAAKAKIDQELQTKYAPKHKAVDDEAEKMLSLTKSGSALSSERKSVSSGTSSKGVTYKVGDIAWKDGKRIRITKIYSDGTAEHEPAK